LHRHEGLIEDSSIWRAQDKGQAEQCLELTRILAISAAGVEPRSVLPAKGPRGVASPLRGWSDRSGAAKVRDEDKGKDVAGRVGDEEDDRRHRI
jgi:hypothetical protein